MTSKFIFDVLDSELRRVQGDLLLQVAKKYNLDHKELIDEFISKPLRVIPNAQAKVEVIRKKPRVGKENIAPECRCHARIWNRGNGGQCTRISKEGSNFCTQHMDPESRKHGDMSMAPSPDVFKPNQRKKALYT